MKSFITTTGALIYVQCRDGPQVTDMTTDEKFRLYHYIRKEIPNLVILFDTKRDLVAELEKQNYFV